MQNVNVAFKYILFYICQNILFIQENMINYPKKIRYVLLFLDRI